MLFCFLVLLSLFSSLCFLSPHITLYFPLFFSFFDNASFFLPSFTSFFFFLSFALFVSSFSFSPLLSPQTASIFLSLQSFFLLFSLFVFVSAGLPFPVASSSHHSSLPIVIYPSHPSAIHVHLSNSSHLLLSSFLIFQLSPPTNIFLSSNIFSSVFLTFFKFCHTILLIFFSHLFYPSLQTFSSIFFFLRPLF